MIVAHERRERVILLTGASSGIGAATARELAHRGHRLVLAARRFADLGQLAGAITRGGGQALPVPVDLREEAQIGRLVRLTLEHFGQLDVLINNAGVAVTHRAGSPEDAQIELVLGTNLVAPIRLTRAVLPHMLARGAGQIINLGSVAGHISAPGQALYNASKHGLRAWNDTLRRELQGTGVSVSLVSPGFIRTDMTSALRGVPMPGPESVARVIARLIERPRREVVTPAGYHLLIGLTQNWPGLTDRVLRRRRLW
jgi:NADP-dependent 3-hydroxy acid dehydrogenase YdfG